MTPDNDCRIVTLPARATHGYRAGRTLEWARLLGVVLLGLAAPLIVWWAFGPTGVVHLVETTTAALRNGQPGDPLNIDTTGTLYTP